MKNITYRGKEFEVEDWVNFVATDESGDIYGYEHEPKQDGYEYTWFDETGGEWCLIYESEVNWRDSLEKV